MQTKSEFEKKIYKSKLKFIQKKALESSLKVELLKKFNYYINDEFIQENRRKRKRCLLFAAGTTVTILYLSVYVANNIISTRCLLPSNFLVWEATRPISDCSFCKNITKPTILWNVTKEKFAEHCYSSYPIIIKNAISHWKATKEFSYNMFKRLYEQTDGSYESLEEGCQFLNFKTDLFSLKEVFNMPRKRAKNEVGEKPWYVGWGNCHPSILSKVRKYYSIPDFLPDDVEYPATENIFFGYEIGAVMHLDYIPRLMWQGQVKGNKTWSIAPAPECEHLCQKFEYYVEPGDIVFLDTRVWYHATSIPKGQFSITVQSEYG